MLFTCSLLYKYDALTASTDIRSKMSIEQKEDYLYSQLLLTAILTTSIVGSLVIAGALLLTELVHEALERAAMRRLRYVSNDEVVLLPKPPDPIQPSKGSQKGDDLNATPVVPHFHLFLSHTWAQGQSDMRIIKQRLKEILPSCVTFLDVDNLTHGGGGDFVDTSEVVLVCCTQKYFASKACARELVRAVLRNKPLIALLEQEERSGAMTVDQIQKALPTDWSDSWGFLDEFQPLGFEALPSGDDIFNALFLQDAIEWNRFGAFQDVTMRLIGERMLRLTKPKDKDPVYLQGEAAVLSVRLKPSAHKFHLYCSPYNAGADKLAAELEKAFPRDLKGFEWTADIANLKHCDRFLVYLTSRTFTSGAGTANFCHEAVMGLRAGSVECEVWSEE